MTRWSPLLLLLAISLPSFGQASGRASTTCKPRVVDPWVRMAPAAMPMGAGFAKIVNPCARDMVIVGAYSSDFGSTSLHETRLENGISRMRDASVVVVRAGSHLQLRPGGLHLMLMEPSRNLDRGKLVRISFRLRDGRSVDASFPVRDSAP